MDIIKKLPTIIIVSVIMCILIVSTNQNAIGSTTLPIVEGKTIKAGVLLYRFDDTYISLVKQDLEEIQRQSQGKVEFTFYDGKNDQSIQNESLDKLLNEEDIDFILLNLVDTRSTRVLIEKIKEKNIPVILFNREPVDIESIKSYNKSFFVGTDAEEAGILQGKILINEWNNKKAIIDRNKDNIMQYIMLMGETNNIEAIERTKYSVLTINNEGIKTQELSVKVCNWNEEEAKNVTRSLMSQFGSKIEVIISNNDSMAIGAISALQEYGYNIGDKTKTIPVVGVDGIPAAQELIKEGIMTGSVRQDNTAMAKALYTIAMNLVYNKAPLEGTEYKFDETGVAIRIPYSEYIYSSN